MKKTKREVFLAVLNELYDLKEKVLDNHPDTEVFMAEDEEQKQQWIERYDSALEG
jgi:hypothetical protein